MAYLYSFWQPTCIKAWHCIQVMYQVQLENGVVVMVVLPCPAEPHRDLQHQVYLQPVTLVMSVCLPASLQKSCMFALGS